MSQGQIQEQTQEQALRQTQSATQLQMMHAKLVELPVTQLTDYLNTIMDDNPALEETSNPDNYNETDDYFNDRHSPDDSDEDFTTANEREERQSALDDALNSIGRDDEDLPVYHGGNSMSPEERNEIIYGEDISFYDSLKEQMGETELTDRQREIMEYIIGSLDDDGLLRKSLDSISDELAIYHNIDAGTGELEHVLGILQDFDPAGIGARSLQECLLIQIGRKDNSRLKELMENVIRDYFDEFTKKHWDKIKSGLRLTALQAETLNRELCRLNPKPGAAMGEVAGKSMQQITPDFIIDTHDDGTVTFTINSGELPELHVSQSFIDTMNEYKTNSKNMSRQMKEALLYTRNKVASAQNFIEALKMRRNTLTITMQAIINWQHRFFEDGDEASLKPMNLKDITDKTGLAMSTISRVSNNKYALTRWGMFPLRFFFSDSYVTDNGEELSTRQIKTALRDIVDAEDKKRPLSDDAIKTQLAEKGFPIARRTVAKYREQLGIPIARLRRRQ